MRTRSLIGIVILASLAGGAMKAVFLPSDESGPNARLSKLASGGRNTLLAATKEAVRKCVKSLNLARDIPEDLIPVANGIVAQSLSETIYLASTNSMKKDKISTHAANTANSSLNSFKKNLSESQLGAIENTVVSISEHPDTVKCVFSNLRAG